MKFYIIVQVFKPNGTVDLELRPAPRPGIGLGLFRDLVGANAGREQPPNAATREWERTMLLMRRIAAEPSRDLIKKDVELSDQLAKQMPRVRADPRGQDPRLHDNAARPPMSDHDYDVLYLSYQELIAIRSELRSRHGSAKYENMEAAYRQRRRDRQAEGSR